MTKKTILIIGAGVEQIPVIQQAKKMGLYVVVSDQNPNAPGLKFANDNFLASTYDSNATIKGAKVFSKYNRKINGVMTAASDIPLTVAKVAHALDLPGNSIETATLAQDKLLMKQHFKTHGIPIPYFTRINNVGHLKKIISDLGFPVIIKPVDSRGARGVLLLTKSVDLEWAYNESKSNSPTGRVMLEEYLEGPQISTECLLYDGFSITPSIADRNYEYLKLYSPYMIENGGELPSRLDETKQNAIRKTAESAAAVLGIKRNSAKGDLVYTKNGPKIIEIAARLSGGYYSSHEIPLYTGVNIVEAVIKLSLGEKVILENFIPKIKCHLVQRYFFPKPGIIQSIENIDQIRKLPFVKLFKIYVKKGDRISKIDAHPKRAGVFIVADKTRGTALMLAEKVLKTIKFRTI